MKVCTADGRKMELIEVIEDVPFGYIYRDESGKHHLYDKEGNHHSSREPSRLIEGPSNEIRERLNYLCEAVGLSKNHFTSFDVPLLNNNFFFHEAILSADEESILRIKELERDLYSKLTKEAARLQRAVAPMRIWKMINLPTYDRTLSIREALVEGDTWAESDEGWEYWTDIHEELLELEKIDRKENQQEQISTAIMSFKDVDEDIYAVHLGMISSFSIQYEEFHYINVGGRGIPVSKDTFESVKHRWELYHEKGTNK